MTQKAMEPQWLPDCKTGKSVAIKITSEQCSPLKPFFLKERFCKAAYSMTRLHYCETEIYFGNRPIWADFGAMLITGQHLT